MNIEFTPEAQRLLDDYTARVRAHVKAAGADAEEVLGDVLDHVEGELAGADQPVAADALGEVLGRLGEPSGWVSEEDMAWWRRLALRLRRGPEDWRLAYLALALLLLGVILGWAIPITHTRYRSVNRQYHQPFPGETMREERQRWDEYVTSRSEPYEVKEYNVYILAFFVAASFLLARAGIAVSPDGRLPDGQKWLTYPTLLSVYLPLACALLLWPVVAGVGIFGELWHSFQHEPEFLGIPWAAFRKGGGGKDVVVGLTSIILGGAMCGIWWIATGMIFRHWPRLPETIFRPFLGRRGRMVGWVVCVGGWVVLALAAAAAGIARWGMPW